MSLSRVEPGPFPNEPGYESAVALDHADPLRGFRDRFFFADQEVIYLDGNSLGRLPVATKDRVRHSVEHEWGDRLIRAWNEGWWDLHRDIGDQLATLIGAMPGEVIVSDSTSVNLYKLALSALGTRPERRLIVSDDLNFPSDLYALGAAAAAVGPEHRVHVVGSDGVHGPVEGILEALDETVALLSLSHTVFKSGYTYDMAALSEAAHRVGAMVLWDLSHSVGALPIDLEGTNVDLAVGCTYKYLNGGPGSPAFLYVRRRLHDDLENPIAGWWGHESPFRFSPRFRPVSGIRRFHTGTMPILSLAAIGPGVSLVAEAGLDRIRAKSLALGEYLLEQWERFWEPLDVRLASPRAGRDRGSHLSFAHPEAWGVARALVEEAGVIPDFRTPDNVRIGLAPLYLGFLDLHTAVQRGRQVLDQGLHLRYVDSTTTVT